MVGRPGVFSLFSAALLGFMGSAQADNYAYMATGSATFGVLDLNTGVFSKCGNMPVRVAGLGVGPDQALYGGAYGSNTLYRIDLTNGSLTPAGTSSINFFLIGSTRSGLYSGGTDGMLYSMDIAGNVTPIGPIGLTGSYWGMSTNATALFLTLNQGGSPSSLFRLNLHTGKAKAIGPASEGVYGAALMERGTLYAGSIAPLAIYALSTVDGSSTLVSNLSGDGISGGPWGLAPILAQHIGTRKICEAHKLPEHR